MQENYDETLIGGIDDVDLVDFVVAPATDASISFIPDETIQQRKADAAIRDPVRFDHLLTHLLRIPDLMIKAGGVLNKQRYFETDPYADAIFRKAYAYFTHYEKLASRQALIVEFREGYETDGHTEHDLENIDKKLTQYFTEIQLTPEHVQDILRGIIDREHLSNLQESLNNIEDLDAGRGILNDAFTRVMADSMSIPQPLNPFDDLESNLLLEKRHPTHISFMDDRLDGGMEEGEMLAFLAPSGGGKSTLGLQLWKEQAMHEHYCAYISLEQPLKGDFSRRATVLAAACTRKDLDNGLQSLSPKLQEALKNSSKLIKKYGKFFDFTQVEIRSVETLLEPIRRMKEAGTCPAIIIIDWWGVAIDQLLTHSGGSGGGSDVAKRRQNRHFIKKLSEGVKDIGTRAVVLHQLSGEAASKGSGAFQSSHAAQEDKNFNNLFDFAITCSKKDEQSVVRLFFDKCRRAANTQVNLKLDGMACRFTNITNLDDGAGTHERYGYGNTGGSAGGTHDAYS